MLAVATSLACQAQPRQRPLDVGPVASGPGTVESERRRLQGSWRLDRFEVIDAAGASRVVRAEAILTYDEYGNLTVRGKLLEPIPGEKVIEHPLLQYAGPIVIDPPKQQFRLGAIKTATAIDPGLESKIDPSFVRKYRALGYDAENFLSERERKSDGNRELHAAVKGARKKARLQRINKRPEDQKVSFHEFF